MSDNSVCRCLIVTAMVIVIIVLDAVFVRWVVNSDLPLWVKVFLLGG